MSKGTSVATIQAAYTVIDFGDVPSSPPCLNDQPLPVATWTYPSIRGQGYPSGSFFIAVFANLATADRLWIAAACKNPVTLTFNDTQYSFVRGSATASLVNLTLTVTLTQLVPVGYTYGQGDFF